MQAPLVETRDALRRTRLANERTYLAWWRSGLTAIAVSFAAGRVVPDLAGGAAWPFEALGAGFGLLGLAFIGYGERRRRAVDAALEAGDYAPVGGAAATVLTAIGLVLGTATIVLVLVNP